MIEYRLTTSHNGEELRVFHAHGDTNIIFERGIATLHAIAPATAGDGWQVVRQTNSFVAYGHTIGGTAVDDLYTLSLSPWKS